MVLDVIAIVEKKQIVKPAIVTRGAVFVLEVTLEVAQHETDQETGNVNRDKKPRCQRRQGSPKTQHQAGLERQLLRPAPAPRLVRVMSQMPVAPEPLRQ